MAISKLRRSISTACLSGAALAALTIPGVRALPANTQPHAACALAGVGAWDGQASGFNRNTGGPHAYQKFPEFGPGDEIGVIVSVDAGVVPLPVIGYYDFDFTGNGGGYQSGSFDQSGDQEFNFTTQNLAIDPLSVDLSNGEAYLDNGVITVLVSCASNSGLFPTVSSLSTDSGPPQGGTSVAITGTGFIGVTAVAFGGVNAATFNVNSDTSITATSPPGSGIADVTVTAAVGSSVTSAADRFTYSGTPTPAPTVSAIASNFGPETGGTQVTITGTNFLTGITGVMFGAVSTNGFYVSDPTTMTVVAPAGTGTVDVTVINAGGTSATSAADRYSYTGADTHDFNGDGYSDIAWRNTSSGDVAIWLMNGTTILQATDFANVPPAANWSIVGQRDFNGDGKADFLWHNSDGDTSIWLMNSTTISQATDLGVVSTTWSVAGTGDFNGDGYGDILWSNTSTGDVSIWLMNGTTILQASDFANVPIASGWTIAGTGDFNGDGETDILWRNTSSGDVAIWLMNGTAIIQATDFANVPVASGWAIVGTGDFNGDGYADILWGNTSTGDVAIWLMNSTTISLASDFANVPVASGWSIAETGDFNGDGKSDIAWRNASTGDVALWLMSGTTISQATDFANVPVASGWTIQGLNAD